MNEPAVKTFHFKEAVGKMVVEEGDSGTVVGVVKDINFASLHAAIEPLVIEYNSYKANYLLLKVNANQLPQTLQFMESNIKVISPSRKFTHSLLTKNRIAYMMRKTA